MTSSSLVLRLHIRFFEELFCDNAQNWNFFIIGNVIIKHDDVTQIETSEQVFKI